MAGKRTPEKEHVRSRHGMFYTITNNYVANIFMQLMFWGSLSVWVLNGSSFWKITNSLPLKIILQMFHTGLPYGCVSYAVHVP